MRARTIITVALAIAMVTSLAVAGATAHSMASSTDAETNASVHAGSHVAFNTTDTAVVDYTVDGAGVIASVEVESAAEAEQRLGVGIGAGATAASDVAGSAISAQVESDTRVTLASGSGASIEAHDSLHGHLVIDADGEEQLVGVTIDGEATAEQESDARVVVTHEDGTQGAFILVGDGEVDVDAEGNVSAHLEGDASLTYRQYEDRDETDEDHERLIADGTAAAEVFLSVDADGEAAADVVSYAEDTTVEVVTTTEHEIVVTAERAESEGKIVIMTLAEAAFETAGDIEVSVDGEAAVHAESTSELEAAAAGGDDPAYAVRQSGTASAATDVAVALNHFSEREMAVSSADDDGDDTGATNGDDNGDDTDIVDSDSIPGFGIGIAVIALTAATLIAARIRG